MSAIVELEVVGDSVDLFTLRAKLVDAIAATPGVERQSLVGVPEGVGPPISPDCPICTGGRGVPCAWHGSADRHDP